MTTPVEVVARILELALEHPAYGCNRLEAHARAGRQAGVGDHHPEDPERARARHPRAALAGPGNQDRAASRSNSRPSRSPSSRSSIRAFASATSRVGRLASCSPPTPSWSATLKGIGRVYLHAVVDTYGSYGFGFLHVSKQPEAAVAVLHNDVLPFYRQPGSADAGGAHRQRPRVLRHRAPSLRALPGAQRDRAPHHPGRLTQDQRLRRALQRHGAQEFFRPAMHRKLYDSVEALQVDLDAWLHHYNHERPHLGYRNQGRRPWETIDLFVRQEG